MYYVILCTYTDHDMVYIFAHSHMCMLHAYVWMQNNFLSQSLISLYNMLEILPILFPVLKHFCCSSLFSYHYLYIIPLCSFCFYYFKHYHLEKHGLNTFLLLLLFNRQ